MFNERVIARRKLNESLRFLRGGYHADCDHLTLAGGRDYDPEMKVVFVAVASQKSVTALKHKRELTFLRRSRMNITPGGRP